MFLECLLRFLHIPLPDGDAAVAGRRGSVPNVSSSHVGHALPDRRGSEPALLYARALSSRALVGSEPLLVTVSNPQPNAGRLTADIYEEGTPGPLLEQGTGGFYICAATLLSICPHFALFFFRYRC